MSIKDKLKNYVSGLKNKASIALMQKMLEGKLDKDKLEELNNIISDVSSGKIKNIADMQEKLSQILNLNKEEVEKVMSDFSNLSQNNNNNTNKDLNQYIDKLKDIDEFKVDDLMNSFEEIQDIKNIQDREKQLEEIQKIQEKIKKNLK